MRWTCVFLLACTVEVVEPQPTSPKPTKQTKKEAPPPADPVPQPTTQLRIMASNLTSGSAQRYEAAGIAILQHLQPDVALMQEFLYEGPLRDLVDQAFGDDFVYYVESEQLPNGIVSRHPFHESGSWDDPESPNRGFAYAHIDLPGDEDLWAISVHLLTRNSSTRDAEAAALMQLIDAAIPSDAWVVLGGDFNTDFRGEACLTTLSARFDTDGPHPEADDGNSNTNATRSKPYDWVLSSHSLAEHETSGFVYVDETHSTVEGMQHMAVIKDYDL